MTNEHANPFSSFAEVDTVLAALAHYKQCGLGDPFNRPAAIHEIAAARDVSLDDAGIDELMTRLRDYDPSKAVPLSDAVAGGETVNEASLDRPSFSLVALTLSERLAKAVLSDCASAKSVAAETDKALRELAADSASHAGEIEAARDQYADDDLEIDDSPVVSPGDGGVWVSAWVWVESDSAEEEGEDAEEVEHS